MSRAGDDGFSLDALPHGIFSTPGSPRRVGVRLGGAVLDVASLGDPELPAELGATSLDAFLALGRDAWDTTRARLRELLAEPSPAVRAALVPLDEVELHLPFAVADYVDFFSSRHHAETTGRILRPQSPSLPAAWEHLPIGYHGRAGSVVVSGTDVVRPRGLRRAAPDAPPEYGPTERLDLEAELGFVVGVPSRPGVPVARGAFADHVFGVVLVNDWSARDVQAFEYVPLGPFLGKSFLTSISAWVLPLAALEAARVDPPARPVPLAAHLDDALDPLWGLDVTLEVRINGELVSRPPARELHWTGPQQLAHLTSNGSWLRTGDLVATGTVSGPGERERGCLLELTWNGERPLTIPGNRSLGYLADGDVVTLSASAPAPGGGMVRLGDVTGRVQPAAPGDSEPRP